MINFDFDPTAAPFGLTVRLETLALGGVIFLVLILTALRAGLAQRSLDSFDGRDVGSRGRLRRDDLILIAFGVVPGAVVGGRLGYALVHMDYYLANPSAVADPSQGGLALSLGVLFGICSGLAVARLLSAPIERWLSVAGIPVLLGLGFGKLTMLLGGSGQGSYSDASWATSYTGPGPWGSVNPSYPAIPSQALEGMLVLAAAAALLLVPLLLRLRLRRWGRVVRPGWSPRRQWSLLTGGRGFVTLISIWAAARFVAAFTWRDARVLGPLCAEQLTVLGVVAAVVVIPLLPRGLRRLRRGWVSRRAAGDVARAARLASTPVAEPADPSAEIAAPPNAEQATEPAAEPANRPATESATGAADAPDGPEPSGEPHPVEAAPSPTTIVAVSPVPDLPTGSAS